MSDGIATGVLDSLLDPIRVDALAERANEGLLSAGERAEYEAFVNALDLIAVLRLKALHNLESNPGA